MILNAEFQNSIIPGIFQELSGTLEFPWKFPIFWQFQGIGCFSHSVLVKELDFQSGIPKFHHSWNLPGIIWNSGISLEISYFLTFSRYRVFFPLSFLPRTWFSMWNPKIPSFLESIQRDSRVPDNSWNIPGMMDFLDSTLKIKF